MKGRETFYIRHTVPLSSCSESKYVLKSFKSKECTRELKLFPSGRTNDSVRFFTERLILSGKTDVVWAFLKHFVTKQINSDIATELTKKNRITKQSFKVENHRSEKAALRYWCLLLNPFMSIRTVES